MSTERVECTTEFRVCKEHLASSLSDIGPKVLSTPSLILFIELACHKCVEKMLGENEVTVGYMVNIKHLKPAPLGGVVRVFCRLVKRDGRRLLFEVKAFYRENLICEGVHERVIVDREKFSEKIEKMFYK